MNVKTLEQINVEIDSNDDGLDYYDQLVACAKDEICKEAWMVWEMANYISRDFKKISKYLPHTESERGEITERDFWVLFAKLNMLGDFFEHFLDRTDNLLNMVLENSPVYRDVKKTVET